MLFLCSGHGEGFLQKVGVGEDRRGELEKTPLLDGSSNIIQNLGGVAFEIDLSMLLVGGEDGQEIPPETRKTSNASLLRA